MLGHDHVPDELEALPAAHFLENLDKTVASADGPEIRPSPIATERHEVQITPSVEPSQRVARDMHGARGKDKIRTLKTAGCGTRSYAGFVPLRAAAMIAE